MVAEPRVALLLERMVGYQHGVLLGVQQYLRTVGERWLCSGIDPGSAGLGGLAGRVEGVIGLFMSSATLEAVRGLGVPAVSVGNVMETGLPTVGVDERGIGRLAAEHLLERGVRSFGYFGTGWKLSAEREAGYRAALTAAGADCCYTLDLSKVAAARPAGVGEGLRQWSGPTAPVEAWVAGLPKPAGIFAVNDERALRVIDACRAAGIRVPEQVAVMGVDDDELLCPFSQPPLTSIATPTERIGFEAAAMLGRLMRGGRGPEGPVLVPPVGVVARQSTDVLAVDDADVVSAVRWVRANATRRIRMRDVLEAVPMARRTLEKRVRQVLGHTLHEEIRRVRLARAKDLLLNTDLAIPAVARKCGFANGERLAEAFRRDVGQSPTAYRRGMRQW